MNHVAELIVEKPGATEPQRVTSIREPAVRSAGSRVNSVYDAQIQGLVQQLFFQEDPSPVRHVGFAALEPQTETAQLCLDVAMALAETGLHDVGLIDVQLQSVPLHTQLQIAASLHTDTSWEIAPHLFLAPRRSWLDDSSHGIWDHSLGRLRTTTMQFGYSILCFDPISWLTPKVSHACHGLVMVLTANKTRRLVAAQMQEQLRKARVPLLGTVLAERRFPVPEGLYRNL
jgi:hypothetical protein